MSKLNTEAQVIEGVGFYYTKIQNSSPKFNPEDGNEFVVDLHVDEETADAWDEEFSAILGEYTSKLCDYALSEFINTLKKDIQNNPIEYFETTSDNKS